ncbi:MAG: spermidine/putrescine ABC transporter substrate-binding protein [Tissierellia bacterium]|nr:spermidine/putrescine ABC transporter substrate-binding protein [Tissierellia bacterium]
MDESLLREFTKETGIKVVVDYFSTNEDMYVKVKQGKGEYDVICPSDYMIERMISEDLIQALDYSKFSIPKLDPKFENLDYDPGNKYSVPYFWGTLGIIYNETEINNPIDSYSDLWNEEYENKVIMPNNQRDAIAVALKHLGYSMNTFNVDELEEAKNALIEQKHLVYAYLGDEARDMILAGNAPIGVVYSGDAYLMNDENSNLKYVLPKEGTNIWVDAWVVPKEAKNYEGALKLIEFLSSPEIAYKNTMFVYGYSTPFVDAMNLLPEEYKNSTIAYPNDEMLEKCEVFHDTKDVIKEYDRIWTHVLSSEE